MHPAGVKTVDKDLSDAELTRRGTAGNENTFHLLLRRLVAGVSARLKDLQALD